MGKKILDSKALYVVLSILIAITMWFYVTSMDGNQRSNPINNIPITFVGEEQLVSRGLMIAGDPPTASITVKATPTVLAQLTNDSVELVVDVSSIDKASEYTLAYTVKLPSNISASQVQFVRGETGNVTFTVAEYRQREIELRGKFVGTTAEGYLAGDQEDFVFTPSKITISGQAELVNQVSYAEVVVDGDNLSETVRGSFPYQFIGASGDVIANLDVTRSVETVQTTFPILATAEVPLEVQLVEGGGVSLDQVKYTMSADTITTPLFKVPLIRAAGVTLKLYARTTADMGVANVPIASGLGYAVTVTTLPYLERLIDYGAKVHVRTGVATVAEDTLPGIEREYKFGHKLRLGSGVQSVSQDRLPFVEREISYSANVDAGSGVYSIMETPINGIQQQ